MSFSRVSLESDARLAQMSKSLDLHVVVSDVDGVFTDGKTWQKSAGFRGRIVSSESRCPLELESAPLNRSNVGEF